MAAPQNSELKFFYLGIFIALAGISLVFLPFLSGMDMMNGGYALIFMCIALVIPAGIVTAVIYGSRARTLARMLNKEDLFAHWTYSRGEWDRYAEEENIREHEAKIGLFNILLIISGVISLAFMIFADDKEAALFSVGVLAAVIIFIRALIYFTGRSAYASNKGAAGEVYLGKGGVLINRTFHSWNFMSQPVSVEIDKKARLLIIEYSAPARNGTDYFTARIPIPDGKEKEAEEIAGKF